MKQMYIGGEWVHSPEAIEVITPYSGEVVDTVPAATPDQLEAALVAAEKGAKVMAALAAFERGQILVRTAELVAENTEELAQLIATEVGKPVTEARGTVKRCVELLRLSAFEGTQLRGEYLPLDANMDTRGKLGFVMRVPCGIVLAISPFNYPFYLVLQKIGPALAAGNSVILKPATQTPLIALRLTELLLEAGLPELGIQTVTGSGSKLGPILCSDSRVRKISFTGSKEVGETLTRVAGIKRLSLELGSNCPMIVLPDADLEQAAQAASVAGYVNAGQVCISLQRIIIHSKVYADFMDALKPIVESIKIGPPLEEESKLSAMISPIEVERVESWIQEAVSDGAELVTGGDREGATVTPTILADVKPGMRVFQDEVFGPAVSTTSVETVDEAIELANHSNYGLAAGIFTKDVTNAMRFAKYVEAGNLHINWTPLWRADFMPYGGLKDSGIGKEGPRYAVESMTEAKTIVIHGLE